jgi:hypothetical protein
MHGYLAFYNGQRAEIRAASLYAAKLAAVAHFKVRKSREHMVSVVFAERADGPAVTHAPGAL